MADWDASDPFAEARKRSGVMDANFGGEQIPLILRHKDVRDAAANYQTFSSDTPFRVPIPSEERVRNVRQLPIEVDPPEHTDYKALVRPFFAAPKQPAMIATIEALVDDAVKQAIREKTVEIVHDFALPLQSRALTVLLGMPMQEAEQWISWGTNVFNDHDGHCEEKGSTLDRYLHAQFDRAEAAPGDDYFSALGAARFRGRALTRDEKIGFANLAFAGGRDTVIATVALTFAHLATHPRDLERLRDEPTLRRPAVEEIVRVASPLTMIGRTCKHGASLGDIDVTPGGRAAICWASANRDETVFDDPESLRIDRKRNPHVAFGAGVHTCLGASHARLVLRSLLSAICDNVAGLQTIDSQARFEDHASYRRQTSYESLTIKITPTTNN